MYIKLIIKLTILHVIVFLTTLQKSVYPKINAIDAILLRNQKKYVSIFEMMCS